MFTSPELDLRVLQYEHGQVNQLAGLSKECNSVSNGILVIYILTRRSVFLSRYMSEAEKHLLSQVILSLENVQYLSIQSVVSNDLGIMPF